MTTTATSARHPSVLFASPKGAESLDLAYLSELHEQGFEVDYTENLEELTRERLRPFDVLVLFVTPNSFAVAQKAQPSSPDRVRSFVQLVEWYLAAGGGLFLMPDEANLGVQRLAEITKGFGAQVPAERVLETNSNNLVQMAHSTRPIRLAYTDQITESPVTAGVLGIWYPYEPMYWAAMTMPLVVDEHWQVVVRASATAETERVDLRSAVDAAPGLLARSQPESRPPLMAIRTVGLGRIALIAEWPQFSFGSGTKWTFDREVLDRGLAGRSSDFGRLLSNTLRWLAEPARTRASSSGWIMPPDRLEAPNRRGPKKDATRAPYDAGALDSVVLPPGHKVYRGLIGARSAYSSGHGNVAEYARAARKSHLDFVVFLEDFKHMSPQKLSQLTTDCAFSSGPDLLLLPGFAVESNLGNRLFFFSPHPAWPPDLVLTGPRNSLLYVQEQTNDGRFTGYKTPFVDWVMTAYHAEQGQVGYYDFVDAPHGIKLYSARLYAMAAVRYYRNGRLIEDILDDYLTTAASTIAPTPVSVDEVDSPEALIREALSNRAMTYARATSLDANARDGLFQSGLRWSNQYDAMPVFLSSGPQILSWPGCGRVATFGAEGFVPERAVMDAPLSVQSAAGLDEIQIYDGPRLFRRFKFDGAHSFEQHLVLDGEIQRNLVVVARDRRGGVAVSFARRSWSDGSVAPVFCSDHVNDCGGMLLAHGPWSLPLGRAPLLPVDIAGRTWDGGPPPSISATGYQDTLPNIVADNGSATAERIEPIPRLEFSDSEAVGVESQRLEAYDDRLLHVVNPWHTFGPLDGPARWFENLQKYREWVSATNGAPETGWAAEGVRTGTSPSLFTSILRFRRVARLRSLQLASLHPAPGTTLVVGGVNDRRVFDLSAAQANDIVLPPGSWFAIYGHRPMNAHLFENRGETLRLRLGPTLYILSDVDGLRVEPGSQYTFELSGQAFPLDRPIAGDEQLARYVDYLRNPTGLRVLQGTRMASPGLLDIAVEDGAAKLLLPRAEGVEGLTLPVRIADLNPRWSVGILQEEGYSPGFYGTGHDRYRALGVDQDGFAYVPLYVDRADITQIQAGHPVVADSAGRDLFIQVTCLGGAPFRWHVSVNNPSDLPVSTVLHQSMTLPGFQFRRLPITIPAGGYVVLQ